MSNSTIRTFAEPTAAASSLTASVVQTVRGNQRFQPLPPPTGPAPYRLKLEDVLPPARIAAVRAAGKLVFHTAADSGGVKKPEPQHIVATHMARDLTQSAAAAKPAFFYNIGDVVYFYGEAAEYYSQFYDVYEQYDVPIFAIPGNHDGDVQASSGGASLEAFKRNFCALQPGVSPDAGDISRVTMTQPNCYWTLLAPFATIVGLYTNVPEGGEVDAQQTAWLINELKSAPKSGALIVALHHPPFSLDSHHSGSQRMNRLLDNAINKSGRVPHLVLAGHVHNYQRFTRKVKNRRVPYLVAGAGGYWHLHAMQKDHGQPLLTPYNVAGANLVLERYCDDRHGFLRLEVTKTTLRGTYFVVPRPHESWSGPTRRFDEFTVTL